MHYQLQNTIAERTKILRLFDERTNESWKVQCKLRGEIECVDLYRYASVWYCASYLSQIELELGGKFNRKHVARFQWIVCALLEKMNYAFDENCAFSPYEQNASRSRVANGIFRIIATVYLAPLGEDGNCIEFPVYVVDLLEDDKFLQFKKFVDPLPSCLLSSKPNFQRLLK